MEPALFFANLAKNHETPSGIRSLSLEWLATFTDKRTKWLTKNLIKLPILTLEVSLEMMLEMDDEDEDIKAWCSLMADEEGEEDLDELYHAG
jgi:hypothetical protein